MSLLSEEIKLNLGYLIVQFNYAITNQMIIHSMTNLLVSVGFFIFNQLLNTPDPNGLYKIGYSSRELGKATVALISLNLLNKYIVYPYFRGVDQNINQLKNKQSKINTLSTQKETSLANYVDYFKNDLAKNILKYAEHIAVKKFINNFLDPQLPKKYQVDKLNFFEKLFDNKKSIKSLLKIFKTVTHNIDFALLFLPVKNIKSYSPVLTIAFDSYKYIKSAVKLGSNPPKFFAKKAAKSILNESIVKKVLGSYTEYLDLKCKCELTNIYRFK